MSDDNYPDGVTSHNIDRLLGYGPVCCKCHNDIPPTDEIEMIWWRGKERPACEACAAGADGE